MNLRGEWEPEKEVCLWGTPRVEKRVIGRLGNKSKNVRDAHRGKQKSSNTKA